MNTKQSQQERMQHAAAALQPLSMKFFMTRLGELDSIFHKYLRVGTDRITVSSHAIMWTNLAILTHQLAGEFSFRNYQIAGDGREDKQ